MKLTVFGPVYSGYSNENSLCILFETENCAILITGDRSGFGERMLLRKHALPDVDILVAGHHGSGDSTTEELLDTVTPETVLISLSEDNNYGHPDPSLLQRLTERGIEILRTDIHGTIDIRR
jgi:competence protein ComEC